MKFKHKETERNRQEQTGSDRIRQDQTGSDRVRQEQTGTDRNRQEQRETGRNSRNRQYCISDIENYYIILLYHKEIHISVRKSRSKEQTGTNRNRQD
jgi:hypothetical protein